MPNTQARSVRFGLVQAVVQAERVANVASGRTAGSSNWVRYVQIGREEAGQEVPSLSRTAVIKVTIANQHKLRNEPTMLLGWS